MTPHLYLAPGSVRPPSGDSLRLTKSVGLRLAKNHPYGLQQMQSSGSEATSEEGIATPVSSARSNGTAAVLEYTHGFVGIRMQPSASSSLFMTCPSSFPCPARSILYSSSSLSTFVLTPHGLFSRLPLTPPYFAPITHTCSTHTSCRWLATVLALGITAC